MPRPTRRSQDRCDLLMYLFCRAIDDDLAHRSRSGISPRSNHGVYRESNDMVAPTRSRSMSGTNGDQLTGQSQTPTRVQTLVRVLFEIHRARVGKSAKISNTVIDMPIKKFLSILGDISHTSNERNSIRLNIISLYRHDNPLDQFNHGFVSDFVLSGHRRLLTHV